MWNQKEMIKLNLQNRKRQTQKMNLWLLGEGIARELGINMYTLVYLKWITNKFLLYSTGNSAQCYVAACMEEEFGGEQIHV